MRQRFDQQLSIGIQPISEVSLPLKKQRRTSPMLRGLQYIFTTPSLNEKVFELLEEKICKGKKKTGPERYGLVAYFGIGCVVPEIRLMVEKFMDNEYYSLHRKFEVLAERPIKDLKDFVKVTAEKFKLFQYECSAKSPEPSLNARMVLDIIHREGRLLQAQPTLWVGYNAFNAVLHGKLKKTFKAQKQLENQTQEVPPNVLAPVLEALFKQHNENDG